MDSRDNLAERFQLHRFLLKDTIRQHVDFSATPQSRGVPAPPLQKPCSEGAQRTDLPGGAEAASRLCSMGVADAIRQRESVRSYADDALTLEELSALLWATQGVRQVLGSNCALRTVPSAGARHAFETYVAVSRVEGLPAGLYRYLPFDGQLVECRVDDQAACDRLLGVDGDEEFTLYIAPVGKL